MAITRHWKSEAQHGAQGTEARPSEEPGLPRQRRVDMLDARSFERGATDDGLREPSALGLDKTKHGAIRKRLGELRALFGPRRVFRLDGGSALTDAEWAALGISPFFAKLRDQGGGGGAGGGCAPTRAGFHSLDGAAGARGPNQSRIDEAGTRDNGQGAR
jgi:hypothetical protein